MLTKIRSPVGKRKETKKQIFIKYWLPYIPSMVASTVAIIVSLIILLEQ